MSGQPLPPRIVEAFAKNAPTCDPSAPIAGGKTFPLPVTSQIGIVNGAASLDDGFVPLNMTDPTEGGVNPYGVDMNGILYLVSAWSAYLAAGQIPNYDSVLQASMGGYAIGAKLASVSTPGLTWTNLVDGNINDPDVDNTGWYSNIPLYVSVSPTAGQHDNYVLPGASDYAIDINTAAGEVDISGFVAQRDGQTLYLSCTGSNIFQALASSTSSSAANRIRAATNLAILQDSTLTIKYFSGISRWLAI